jgi:hypothetical protein
MMPQDDTTQHHKPPVLKGRECVCAGGWRHSACHASAGKGNTPEERVQAAPGKGPNAHVNRSVILIKDRVEMLRHLSV